MFSIETPQALLSAIQMNSVELHEWNYTASHVDRPDRVVFDMDPGEGVPFARDRGGAGDEGPALGTGAEELAEDERWPRAARGGAARAEGPHARGAGVRQGPGRTHGADDPVALRVEDGCAKSRGQDLRGLHPQRGGSDDRVRVLGARTAGPGVSMPIAWDQIHELTSGAQWNIATAVEYLRTREADPWEDYWRQRQSIAPALKTLRAA